jgi:hypothetical protein
MFLEGLSEELGWNKGSQPQQPQRPQQNGGGREHTLRDMGIAVQTLPAKANWVTADGKMKPPDLPVGNVK